MTLFCSQSNTFIFNIEMNFDLKVLYVKNWQKEIMVI